MLIIRNEQLDMFRTRRRDQFVQRLMSLFEEIWPVHIAQLGTGRVSKSDPHTKQRFTKRAPENCVSMP